MACELCARLTGVLHFKHIGSNPIQFHFKPLKSTIFSKTNKNNCTRMRQFTGETWIWRSWWLLTHWKVHNTSNSHIDLESKTDWTSSFELITRTQVWQLSATGSVICPFAKHFLCQHLTAQSPSIGLGFCWLMPMITHRHCSSVPVEMQSFCACGYNKLDWIHISPTGWNWISYRKHPHHDTFKALLL